MQKSAKILLYLLAALLLIVIVVVSNMARRNALVQGIVVEVDYAGSDTLVRPATIEALITHQIPTLGSQRIRDLNLEKITAVVMENPYAAACKVSTSVNSRVVVRLSQRIPVARLFVAERECYVDRDGRVLPLSEEGSADVLVASGDLQGDYAPWIDSLQLNLQTWATDSLYAMDPLVEVWQMARYFYDHPTYGALFDQLYIMANKDMVLVPKVGDHTVLLSAIADMQCEPLKMDNATETNGATIVDAEPDVTLPVVSTDASRWMTVLDQKMSDLLAFYRQGMPEVGWKAYRQINLKYTGQVICTNRK